MENGFIRIKQYKLNLVYSRRLKITLEFKQDWRDLELKTEYVKRGGGLKYKKKKAQQMLSGALFKDWMYKEWI